MIRIRIPRPLALGLLMAASWVCPAVAQTEIVAAPNPEADRLAEQVRALAVDPRDVNALLTAGLLSARLGDTSAALAFFQRAESVDPGNPRILAGRGSALVRLERPGEALRLFQTAEARGVPVRDYAADRGFAYDLLGSPDLAQRDYALALASGDRDEETVRRYALSLGGTGRVEMAMAQLDTLLRKSDRAAWRARAFILAMNGDVAGAERIAASMMPGSLGQSLAPFFRRLATLSPADRAFAVHFGELSPTQARLADARLAPALPRYVPEARPVQVAATPVKQAPRAEARDRRSRRERERDERAARAKAAPVAVRRPVAVAAAAPLPVPPQFVPPPPQPIVQPLPTPAPSRAPVQLASAGMRAPERGARQQGGAGDGPEWPLHFDTPPTRPSEARPPAAAPAPQPSQPRAVLPEAGRTTPGPRVAPPPAAAPAPSPTPPEPRAATPAMVPDPVRSEPPAPLPASQPEPQPEPRAAPTPPGPARVGQEDSVLAAIMGKLTIPGEELEVVTRAPTAPVPSPEAAPTVAPAAVPAPAKAAPVRPEAKPKPEPAKAEPKAKIDSKAKLDPKAKPDAKAKKPDPKKDPAKLEPARVWVQVAGGANAESLPKAWRAVAAKAPVAFKGKSAWSTPLRATNRVLAGPFKTAAEAQAFVNAAAKSGVSAFVFTSEAGQKVTRLEVQ